MIQVTSSLSRATMPLLVGALSIAAMVTDASAAVVAAGNRGAVLGATTLSWGTLGGDMTSVGSSATVGIATATGAPNFTVFEQSQTWAGNFAAGESVLSMFDLDGDGPLPGVFDISFSTGISGFATQVQDFLHLDDPLSPQSVTLSLFDAANSLLGSFNFSGASTSDADGSALLVGALSDSLDIRRITITGLSAGSGINQLTVGLRGPDVGHVPEPMSLALVFGALGAASLARRKSAHAR